MKYFLLVFLFIAQSALACWKAEGTFAVDGETYKFSQKINHNMEYKFPGANFILSMTLKPIDKKTTQVTYKIEEKKNLKLILVTMGTDEVTNSKSSDIFAKGEEGQPNSIISIKLTDI